VFIGHGVKLINDLYPHATTPEGKLQGEADWTVLRTLVRHAMQHRCRRELRKGSDSPAGQDDNLWPDRLRNIHCENLGWRRRVAHHPFRGYIELVCPWKRHQEATLSQSAAASALSARALRAAWKPGPR